MSESFRAVKVTDRVYWVGAIDWGVRDFHGYLTRRGTTYNAYLVMADKVTLIDTVKVHFKSELLSRIASVIDPEKIDYVISNHAEMDHSGSLPEVIQAARPEKVFASQMGVKALKAHFHMDREINPLKDGDTLSLGNMNLTFLETRMLHWPDSMVTYLAEDRLLFSQDGFGMHLASSQRFADEVPEETMEWEGAKYFANILMPYSSLVLKLLERVSGLGVKIDIIAPDHGPIWRKDPGRIVGWWKEWAGQKPKNKAVIVFDTMWQSTAKMANAIQEGLIRGGAIVKLMPLKSCHRSDVVTEILDAGAVIVGSPTVNNNVYPSMADMMTYLKGLKPQNKIGAVFGSYGWSGEGTRHLVRMLEEMKIECLGEVRSHYVPDGKTLEECEELGAGIAKRLKEG